MTTNCLGRRGTGVQADAGISGEAASELSRGEVLLKGALAVSAIYGAGAVAPFVSRALAVKKGNDLEILNYLLPFEYLQVSIANRASSEKGDRGEPMPLATREKEFLQMLLKQDGEHVEALKRMIEEMGGKPVKKGGYAFDYRIFREVLEIIATIENASVGAYNGTIVLLSSNEARELVYSMVQTDARHATAALIGRKEEPATVAFDHAVPEQDSMFHVLPYTGVYPKELPQPGGES